MKKIFSILFVLFSFSFVFAQTNSSVDLKDDVYVFLSSAENQGLCETLSTKKPYTEKYILSILNSILENVEQDENVKNKDQQIQIIQSYINKYKHMQDGVNLSKLAYKISNGEEESPISFEVDLSMDTLMSAGIYSDSSMNSFGYEVWGNINFAGDIGDKVSYKANGFVELVDMPQQTLGQYNIGQWWYNDAATQTTNPRNITKYRNNSFLPYSYTKHFDGSVYFLTNVSCDGLEGWPFDTSFTFGMSGEIRASLFNDKFDISFGRTTREWSAMDEGSSLILNSRARPFLGIEASLQINKNIRLSTLTGVLEFPNQDYITKDAWYYMDNNGNKNETLYYDDAMAFQNCFSLTEFDLDINNFHFDFGSSCIWPKRVELGYLFPLIDSVIYQNDVGDYDNLALFGNLKYTIPGYGKIWLSGYLEEVNSLKSHFWDKTRCMFAYQAGTKANIPLLPFTTVSFRYTKIEPYCYTHNAICAQPWSYGRYISESYTNNGECLGYYLQPNSDEFFLRLDTRPFANFKCGFQWQLIRHGVDWGSESVRGSNIYSELSPTERSEYYKYFLQDGVYEWTNILALDASYNFTQIKFPLMLNMSIGYVYDWFTKADGGIDTKSSYHDYSSSEYSGYNGFVCSLGIKAFF